MQRLGAAIRTLLNENPTLGPSATLAILGLLYGWAVTSPAILIGINWDTGSTIAAFASGQAGWSSPPWNSHLAVGQVYFIAHEILRPLGATYIDAVRLANAGALGISAAFVAFVAARLCRGRIIALLAGLLFMTAWGISILVMTVEDNVLYSPAATGLAALCLVRSNRWDLRASVVAGLLGAAGCLISWQAGVYLFLPLFTAMLLGGEKRGGAIRARDAGAVLVVFAATMLAWTIFYSLAAPGLTFKKLSSVVLSRPEPSFFPRSLGELLKLLGQPSAIAEHAGHGVIQELGPFVWPPTPVHRAAAAVGAAFLVICALVTLSGIGLLFLRRRASVARLLPADVAGRFVLLAVSMGAIALVTAPYLDLPIDKYKRYDFLPLFLVFFFVWTGAAISETRRWARRALIIVAAATVLTQTVLVATRSLVWRKRLPTAQPLGYYGVGTEPWYAYMSRLRKENPQACRFVFALAEVSVAGSQQELTASLWSELPDHLVIGASDSMAGWRWPVRIAKPDQAKETLGPCDWLSPGARGLVSK